MICDLILDFNMERRIWMKKITALLAAALMVLFTTACGDSSLPAGGGELPVSETETPALTAEITHGENLPEELAGSVSYQEALTHPGVICYNYEVLTSPRDVQAFADAYAQGKSCELYYYSFYSYPAGESEEEFHSLYGMRFTNPGDGTQPYLQYLSAYNDDGTALADGDGGVTDRWSLVAVPQEPPVLIDSMQLSEYGMLVAADVKSSEPTALRVISYYDMIEDYGPMKAALERFIRPIAYDHMRTFDSVADIAGWMALYNDIYCYADPDQNDGNLWQKYPDSNIPVEAIAALLGQYFDVTAEDLRSSFAMDKGYGAYDALTDTVYYTGGRGGYYADPVVTGCTVSEDGTQAEIDYYTEDMFTAEPQGRFCMTVRLLPDGSFRYLSLVKTN